MTLVEVMVAMIILAAFMLGFVDASLQSRRISEGNVMQSAANTMAYGLIEQMKMLDYSTGMPTTTANASADQLTAGYDSFPGAGKNLAAFIDVQLNQDQRTLLQCVYSTSSAVFNGPKVTPATVTALNAAMMNTIGPIPLSTVTGTQSQSLTLYMWVWVDTISDITLGVNDAKCVTIIYAYDINLGRGIQKVIKREVFIRTPYVQLEQ